MSTQEANNVMAVTQVSFNSRRACHQGTLDRHEFPMGRRPASDNFTVPRGFEYAADVVLCAL